MADPDVLKIGRGLGGGEGPYLFQARKSPLLDLPVTVSILSVSVAMTRSNATPPNLQ